MELLVTFHRVGRILFLATLAGLASGCSNSDSEQLSSRSIEYWRVEIAISGGLAGVRRRMTLDSNGQLKVSDQKRNLSITKQAPDSLVVEVGQLIKKGAPDRAGNSKRNRLTGCLDCFEYRIIVTTDNKTATAIISGLPVNDSTEWKLVRLMVPHLEKTLAVENK